VTPNITLNLPGSTILPFLFQSSMLMVRVSC